MERIFKLVRGFFPNRFRETKEQKSLAERTLLLSWASYSGLAVAKRSGCFMPTGIRNEIPTPKQQSRNEEALKLAQQILDKEVKILSPAILQAIKNDTRQMIENRKAEKNVPAPESRTSFETPTTRRQKTWRDKFSETVPKTFAPPE
ncbi:MAG: hypothetical protein LBG15_07495 [Dysgonamonadaceae bacterium]|jgi:hypothetical protein|nr:hypothetical protein [Dysgonamonadaceae bacterium]